MKTAAFKVLEAGPSLTIQDLGRPGYQRFGITEGGVIDRWALAEGNTLLGNDLNTAALEMATIGGKFTVTGTPIVMATSGAEMDLKLDGTDVPWRSSFTVLPGQVVHCGVARHSVYSYLHVQGGFDVATVLDSRATHIRSGFGGHMGRRLCSGDKIPLSLDSSLNTNVTPLKLPAPEYLKRETIRVLWGTQAHVFGDKQRELLLQSEFAVTVERDRMGARLATDAGSLAAETGLTGISDAVLAGDIQVAGDGVGTVLLADRQPTGGYPRIATVISADLDAIAQIPVNRPFRFSLVSTDEAVDALLKRKQKIAALSDQLQAVVRSPADVPDLLSYNLVDGVVAAEHSSDVSINSTETNRQNK